MNNINNEFIEKIKDCILKNVSSPFIIGTVITTEPLSVSVLGVPLDKSDFYVAKSLYQKERFFINRVLGSGDDEYFERYQFENLNIFSKGDKVLVLQDGESYVVVDVLV